MSKTKYFTAIEEILKDVNANETIWLEELLDNYRFLKVAFKTRKKYLREYIELNQNQFDALVSHAYNTGGSETLFELINSQSSSIKICHWIENTYITSGGNLILGLVKRRQIEADLFFEPMV